MAHPLRTIFVDHKGKEYEIRAELHDNGTVSVRVLDSGNPVALPFDGQNANEAVYFITLPIRMDMSYILNSDPVTKLIEMAEDHLKQLA